LNSTDNWGGAEGPKPAPEPPPWTSVKIEDAQELAYQAANEKQAMTATITELTRNAILFNSPGSTAPLEIVVILVLLALLIQSEFLRALGGARARLWRKTLNIIITPLLLVFLLIVAVHIAEYVSL
jgi:hypothetical protein